MEFDTLIKTKKTIDGNTKYCCFNLEFDTKKEAEVYRDSLNPKNPLLEYSEKFNKTEHGEIKDIVKSDRTLMEER